MSLGFVELFDGMGRRAIQVTAVGQCLRACDKKSTRNLEHTYTYLVCALTCNYYAFSKPAATGLDTCSMQHCTE